MTVNRRQLQRQPRRDAWVEVNLSALEYNCRLLRQAIPDSLTLMAVMKADAYGHGALMTLPTLEACGVSMVGVASMDEALEIRQVNDGIPILVLGPTPDWAVEQAAEQAIQLTIFDIHHVQALVDCYERTGQVTTVHIKVDTGMHRVGVPWHEATTFIHLCQTNQALNVIGLFTHLASGDNLAFTRLQAERWITLIHSLGNKRPPVRHILNSDGLQLALNQPELGTQLINPDYSTVARVGLAFWGYGWPKSRAVMGLKGRITHKQSLSPGEGVSYGQFFKTSQATTVATLPLGYADGLARRLSNHLMGDCKGYSVNQIGLITMDQLMWDVTHVPEVKIGDIITLLDHQPDSPLTIDVWAEQLGTIPYELLCALRVRLPKIYVRD